MTDPRAEDRERYAAMAERPRPGEVCPVCEFGVHPEHEDLVRRDLDGERRWLHDDCAEAHEMGRRP